MSMHPARFFRELTRVPTWRLEGDGLLLPAPSTAFVMQRREVDGTCTLNFTRTMRLNQAVHGMIVSPDGLHIAPTLKVELASRVTEYDPQIRFRNKKETFHSLDTPTFFSGSRQFGKEILVPKVTKTYDLYGIGGQKAKLRCMKMPMRVNEKITRDNDVDYDDRPFIGLIASDGGGNNGLIDCPNNSSAIFLSQRRAGSGAIGNDSNMQQQQQTAAVSNNATITKAHIATQPRLVSDVAFTSAMSTQNVGRDVLARGQETDVVFETNAIVNEEAKAAVEAAAGFATTSDDNYASDYYVSGGISSVISGDVAPWADSATMNQQMANFMIANNIQTMEE